MAKKRVPVLENFSTELNHLYLINKLPDVVSRDKEIDLVNACLRRAASKSVLIVGNSGVGKTALVHGLVAKQFDENITTKLKRRFYELDLVSLLSGTRYRGQFEERVKAIEHELTKNRDVTIFIENFSDLFLDEYYEYNDDKEETIKQNYTLYDILKKKIREGEISLVTCTDIRYYEEICELHPDINSIFLVVDIDELSTDQIALVVKENIQRFELFHKVSYNNSVVELIMELSDLYLTEMSNPGRALLLVDSVGAKVKERIDSNLPDYLKDLFTRVENARNLKDDAVKNQQYEKAADLRDQESKLLRKYEEAEKSWMEEKEEIITEIVENDIYEVLAEIKGVDSDIIRRRERIGKNENASEYFKNRLNDFELDGKSSIVIDKIPEVLKTCLQQYILFFKEFLKKVKGKEIYFNVTSIAVGLRIDIDPKEIGDFEELQKWFDEYMGYIYERGKEFKVEFEKEVSDIEAKLAMAELKNQIRYLEGQLEINKLTIENLRIGNESNAIKHRLEIPQKLNIESCSSDNRKAFVSEMKILLGKAKTETVIDEIIAKARIWDYPMIQLIPYLYLNQDLLP